MLSTHTLTLSKTSFPPGSLRALPTLAARSGSLPRRPRPYQQVRAFRIGLWSSYLDANFQKEFRRRQRIVKHKYIEALNRKLSWDRHFPMHLRHLRYSGLKSFMCSAWRGGDSRPGGRWVNSEDLEYMNQNNVEKGRGIEDVEQNALNHLLDHHRFMRAKASMYGPGWSTYDPSSRAPRPDKTSNNTTSNAAASSSVYGSEGFRKRFQNREYQHEEQTEYEIDPITNRKVPKKSAQTFSETSKPVDIPVKTFKGYRSQFKDFQPPKEPKRTTETQSSQQANTTRTSSHVSESYDIQRQGNEVDPLAKYDEKVGFKSGRQYDPAEMDIDYSDPDQQGLKSFDDKLSGTTSTQSTANDGSTSTTNAIGRDGLEAYDEKVKNQVRQFFASPHEEVEPVDPVKQAIDRYNAFKDIPWSRVVRPEKIGQEDKILQAKRDYELSPSRKAFVRDQQAFKLLDSIREYHAVVKREGFSIQAQLPHEKLHPLLKAIREYEASMADKKTNPHELAPHDKTDPLLRAIREYKNFALQAKKSSPVVVEKDGLDPLLSSIDEYEASVLQPVARNGRNTINAEDEECLKSYDAKVNFYRRPNTTSSVDEAFREVVEKGSGRLTTIKLGLKWPTTSRVASTKHEIKLSEEEAAWKRKGVDGLAMEDRHSEIKNEGSRSESSDEPKSWAYLPQRIRELFAREEKSDAEKAAEKANDEPRNAALRRHFNILTAAERIELNKQKEEKLARRNALEQDFENAQMAEVDAKLSTERLRQRTATLQSDILEAQKAEVDKSVQIDKSKKMTGNFVQDFPEEFETAWTTSEEISGVLTRKDKTDQQREADVQNGERVYIESNAGRLQPALDRAALHQPKSMKASEEDTPQIKADRIQQGEGDLSSSMSAYMASKSGKAAGLEAHTARAELQKEKNAKKEEDRKLIREVRGIYEDAYGAIDMKHRQVPSEVKESIPVKQAVPAPEEAPEPTMYKILAYDPTMQSISSAETTSVVPDSSGPLTPAEVLLRLSNPAKFFPHFEPLRAQGYEIVSGSGDVLVFRKVREASPLKAEKESSAAAAAKEDKSAIEHKKNVMNPIDGMTRGPIAATGDFASPTGFVNHDIPRGSEPPFKSNIDVRREEPVFSGKRNWNDNEGKRKERGFAKTALLGAGWLAACSYAIGVVADYFKTGGADGEGPKGF